MKEPMVINCTFLRWTRKCSLGVPGIFFPFRIDFPDHPFYFASVPEGISQTLGSPAGKSPCKEDNTPQAESSQDLFPALSGVTDTIYICTPGTILSQRSRFAQSKGTRCVQPSRSQTDTIQWDKAEEACL